jgi:UDP-N-acetylglucosamine 3-dehydrogenase
MGVAMADKKALRVAVIGCGSIGRLHAQAVVGSESADLVGVCDTDEQKVTRVGSLFNVGAYRSYEEMFSAERLDVVTIATPDHLHVAPTMAAIQRGLHVFCEKPLAASLSEAESMTHAAAEFGVSLGVDYNRRFGFGYCQARKLLDRNTDMSVRQAVLQVCDGVPAAGVSERPYALLTTLASHHLDLLRWFGGEVQTVQATLRGPTPDRPYHVTILLESTRGTLSCLQASWRAGQSRTTEHLRLITDHQVICVEDVQQEVTVWHESPDSTQRFLPNSFAAGNRFYDTVVTHLSAFLNAMAKGHEAPVSGPDGCATLRLIEAAIESHHTGRRINVPLPERVS